MYSKKQLAEMFGVSPWTIHNYRRKGILPPPLGPSDRYATYGAEHVEIMRDIWGWNGLKDTNRTLADFAEARAIAAEERA